MIHSYRNLIYVAFLLLLNRCGIPQDQSGNTMASIEVPEGYEVSLAAGPDLLDYPMFATLDETGRLFVFESIGNVYEESQQAIDNPQFRIKVLEDLDGDGRYDKSTVFADKLSFPQGGVFYKGSLYASSAPDLLKLTDTDGDGVADQREVILSGWTLNVNANSLIGPFMGADGWLYLTSAIMGFDVESKEGKRLKGETARIWRVRPDGTDLEWISAGGMNNPVELVFTNAGEVLGTQTFFIAPQRGLRDAITFWVEGGIYGKKNNNISRDSLPLTGELMPVAATYSRVAPSGIAHYRSSFFGADFSGNLFTAQFNTHQVLRHQVMRDGGTFQMSDEVFFESSLEDFHPTDVLEDGDGSLMVVETGGWFILGCPLSQVSKPQLEGAIYRIRRKDAPPIADPYGNSIQWESLDPQQLVQLLEDPRPFVNDRASQALVDRGNESVKELVRALEESGASKVRIQSVFTLYKIGSPEAISAIHRALSDKDQDVQVAAAKVLGMARDTQASSLLVDLLNEGEHAAKRQAATALGQIGSEAAIPDLLDVAGSNKDRFVRHSAMYALMCINMPDLVLEGLSHSSPAVKEAALIVLDQMPGSPITPEQVTPFLESEDEELKSTALWVASHHPDWDQAMIKFMERRLAGPPLNEAERQLLSQVLTAFCGNPSIQRFIVDQMQQSRLERKIFLLKNMMNCQVEAIPDIWSEQLHRELLTRGNSSLKAKVVELIKLRSIAGLQGPLKQVADDPANPKTLRVNAIGALLATDKVISEPHFSYLFSELSNGSEAPYLQQIVATLAQADLTQEQLLAIAGNYLSRADHFILPRLVPLFAGGDNPEIGGTLAKHLAASPVLDNFTQEDLQVVFANYEPHIRPELDALYERLSVVRGERLQRLQALTEGISEGDIENGRELFFGKAICYTCHAMGAEGGNLGPDLTSIQKDRSVHDILEAILYPSVSFVREYETYEVVTQTDTFVGIIQEQNPDAIVLASAPGNAIRIPRTEIKSISTKDISLMPQGLNQLLSENEFADLMAYLLGEDLIYW